MRLLVFFVLFLVASLSAAQEEFVESKLLSMPLSAVEDSLISVINSKTLVNDQIKASIWLARMYSVYGIDDKADSLFKSNRRFIINAIDSESDLLALNNIQHSKVYQIHEQWTRVRELVDESINIKRGLNNDSTKLIDDYNQLVWYYQAIRYFDSANYYADKAIKLSKDLKGNERHYKLAKSYNNKGYTLNYERQCDSREWLKKALQQVDLQTIPHDLTLARIYHNYGNSYNDQVHSHCKPKRSFQEILAYYDLSLNIYNKFNNPSRIGLNQYVRSVAYQRVENYRKAIELLAEAVKTYRSARVENTTMHDLSSSRLSVYLTRHTQNVDSLKWAYTLMRDFTQDYIQKKQNDLAFKEDLFIASYGLFSGSESIRLGMDLFEHTGDSSYLNDVLQLRKVIKYPRSPRSKEPFFLDNETVIIDYYTTSRNSIAIVQTNLSVEIIPLIGVSKMVVLLNEYERVMKTNNTIDHNKILHGLYSALIEPIDKKVGLTGKRLIIIPDPILEVLDFASLNTEVSKSNDFRKLPYLIYDNSILYGSAISLLKSSTYKKFASKTKLVADPLDNSLEFSRKLTKKLSKRYLTTSDQEMEFGEVIHLAGHVIPNYKYQELSRIPAFDLLDEKELSDSSMKNVEMMVIQGCRGADGQLVLSEGRYSFNRMFQNLGVQSVVSTKWDLDDYYSSKVFGDYYSFLDLSNRKSKALAKAQKKFIKEAKSSLEAHPRNWAGIVIYGDDSPIEIAKNKMYNQVEWYAIFITLPLFLFVGKRMLNRHMGEKDQKQSV